jgi:uncharacterized protein YndB with AHSA1/START domain
VIRISRALPAEPERVWQALTDPAALCSWFWPESAFGTTAEVDLGEGYRIDGPKAGLSLTGRYLTVDPPKRLVMTWQWAGEDGGTMVRIELAPDGEGTVLTLTHEGFADGTTRDEHVRGWSDCLARLPAWLGA